MSKREKLTPEEQEQKIEGSFKNLMEQVDKIHRNNREGSIDTRKTYYNAERQFCKFLASEYRLVNVKNIEARHLYAYVDYMQEKGLSASYIYTSLSGIRFYQNRIPGARKLPRNEKFDLEHRHPGMYNRAWMDSEIDRAINVAKNMRGDQEDVIITIKLGSCFGLRSNEIVTVKVCHIEYALETGQLHVPRGKGKHKRDIPVDMPGQRELLYDLYIYARKRNKNPDDYLLCDGHEHSVLKEKRRLRDWFYNHKSKFQDPDRADKIEPGKKPRTTERLGLHSLRHSYTQNHLRFLREQGKLSEHGVEKEASESLGHHRTSITKIYEE